MTIYTNTNKVAESLFSLVDVNVEVEPFRKWPTCRDVFIFDERIQDLISDYNQVLHENTVLRMRPDWGGFHGIMDKNFSTSVFSKQWYRVWFYSGHVYSDSTPDATGSLVQTIPFSFRTRNTPGVINKPWRMHWNFLSLEQSCQPVWFKIAW